uniref:Small RNA 2'-O-methyltransferase n=1 Tax=Pleurobrachia bachei TaxID=34499 RepID=U3KTQ0_PLEBA|nr:Hen1 [Pleurobrachia bachei]
MVLLSFTRTSLPQVVEICRDLGVTSVADLGCAELTLFQYFKNMETITRVVSVDLDKQLLEANARKTRPLMLDHMTRRDKPLDVSVLCGSATEFDGRVAAVECVCAIELIEHLPFTQVDDFTANIFQRLLPKYAVISTPNKDFNVLFNFVPGQVRHWDHKFEWTREEFVRWCEGVKDKYGYSYTLTGVGEYEEDNSFGFCSQFAIFTQNEDFPVFEMDTSQQPYEEVYSVEYPVRDPSDTPDRRLTHELMYIVTQIGMERWDAEGEEESCVAISHLQTFPAVGQYEVSDEHVARLVELHCEGEGCDDMVRLSEDRGSIVVRNVPPSPSAEKSDCSSVRSVVEIDEEEVW